jgi:hypothetical protein
VRAVDTAGNEDKNSVELLVALADVTPPVFGGATGAAGLTNAITLFWNAGTDDNTPASALTYLIYRSTGAGAEDFAAPVAITTPGVTSFTVPSLVRATTYYFVVRARDQAGNLDANSTEVSAKTIDANDIKAPTFAGLTGASTAGTTAVSLTWSAASDDFTPADQMVYFIYVADGGSPENFSTPSYATAPGATSFLVTGLQASHAYRFFARARDLAGNTDSNGVEKDLTTGADNTPPTFAGAVSIAQTSASSLTVSYAPAADDVTPASQIVYLAYLSTSSGAEAFAATSAPGATSIPLTGLAPQTTYYVIVRAKDAAGNIDGNAVERSAATLP